MVHTAATAARTRVAAAAAGWEIGRLECMIDHCGANPRRKPGRIPDIPGRDTIHSDVFENYSVEQRAPTPGGRGRDLRPHRRGLWIGRQDRHLSLPLRPLGG